MNEITLHYATRSGFVSYDPEQFEVHCFAAATDRDAFVTATVNGDCRPVSFQETNAASPKCLGVWIFSPKHSERFQIADNLVPMNLGGTLPIIEPVSYEV